MFDCFLGEAKNEEYLQSEAFVLVRRGYKAICLLNIQIHKNQLLCIEVSY